VDLHRLVDSKVLRNAMKRNYAVDLGLVLTHTLHDEVIRPGYLDKADFTQVEVKVKEFAAPAWLPLS